ncbi:hypothetical protein [Emticicia sp. C21]|uniref:hypothetical protein n=1 Tax=Emticicia sp. C21 TaxID=2302915 RepID=UPI000E34519F|nr:hypothetical protein [Emticicia sp. C21]RFS14706.1 hypothetical protein D0T08_20985 [Emticicia sp. C21]
MNIKTYLNFIISNYADYLSSLGYNKIYQDGNTIRIDKKGPTINNNLMLSILKYNTIALGGFGWGVQLTEIDTPIIRTVLRKENQSEKYIKDILNAQFSIHAGVNLVNEQKVLDIYTDEDATKSFELVRSYFENEIEPFFAKHSKLRNIYDFLVAVPKQEFWDRVGGKAIYYRELFIYKIYNEEKYQEYLKEVIPLIERDYKIWPLDFYKAQMAAFDELVAYIENNVTRLRELYDPEML